MINKHCNGKQKLPKSKLYLTSYGDYIPHANDEENFHTYTDGYCIRYFSIIFRCAKYRPSTSVRLQTTVIPQNISDIMNIYFQI